MRELRSLVLDVMSDCQAMLGGRAYSLFTGLAIHLRVLRASCLAYCRAGCRLQHWWNTLTHY